MLAPAGYGKTSLLALTLTDHPACAWYTAQLWHAGEFTEPLALEVRRVRPDFGRLTLALATRGTHGDSVHARAARAQRLGATFAAELGHVAEPLAVVFEDVHLLAQDSAFGEFIVGLMRVLPGHVRLAIAGRSLPALPLAEWLAQGRAHLFGPDDLRFDDVEVVALARERGLALGEERVAELRAIFEGWPAGLALQFAAGDRPVPSSAGALPAATAYLIEATVAALEPELLVFLERTAVFETLSAPLLERDRELSGVRRHLAELERRGVMLGVVSPGHVYRLHPLLREALLGRLRMRGGADGVRARHRWAGDLLERSGKPVPALYHLEAAEDHPRLATFLRANAYALFIAGHGERAAKIARALEVAAERYAIVSGQLEGMLLRQRGAPGAAERFGTALQAAREAQDAQAELALRFLLTEDRLARGEALGAEEIEELVAGAQRAGTRWEVDALTFAGWSCILDAAFPQARGRSRAALALAEDDLVAFTRVASLDAYASICLGLFEEADSLMSRALRLLEGSDHVVLLANTLVWCARFALVSGDVGAAKDYAEQGERLSRKLDLPSEVAGAALALAEVYAHEADRARCEAAAHAAASFGGAAWYWADRERAAALAAIFTARARCGSESPAAALESARAALDVPAPAAQRATQLVEAAAYAALAGERPAALEFARRAAHALHAASPADALDALALAWAVKFLSALEAHLGTALQAPDLPSRGLTPYGSLLARRFERHAGESAANAGMPFEFVLLRALQTGPRPAPQRHAGPRGAALTKREREILELLALGLTNKEIAQRFSVSPRTVDTHVERVLSKLGATTRTRAVAAAIRSGLVSS